MSSETARKKNTISARLLTIPFAAPALVFRSSDTQTLPLCKHSGTFKIEVRACVRLFIPCAHALDFLVCESIASSL